MESLDKVKLKRHLEFYKFFFLEKIRNPSQIWSAICERVETVAANSQLKSNAYHHNTIDILIADLIFNYVMSSQCPFSNLNEFLHLIQEEGGEKNKILVGILNIDPDKITIGRLSWEKIILDLFDELTILVDFDDLCPLLVEHGIILPLEQKWINTELLDNPDKMAQLLCLVSQRCPDLQKLRDLLICLHRPTYVSIANQCSPLTLDEFEWMEINRDFFIEKAQNVKHIALHLKDKAVLTTLDVMRLEKLRFTDMKIQAKHLFDTLQRKTGEIRLALIESCESVEGNTEIVMTLKFKPTEIQIPYNAFQLLQFNWSELLTKVNYERVAIYLASRDFLKYKEHLRCKAMETNEEKMEYILNLAVTREDFYDAFFHIMSLSGHRQLFRNCYPMSFEEKKIILEVQDFLAQEIKFTNSVCEELGKIGALHCSDFEYIKKMPSTLTKNLAVLNILKSKSSQGITLKLLNVLWKTKNRNCAEILAVDFTDFQMTIQEWNKLKSNWSEIVKTVNYEHVSSTFLNTGIISEKEHEWIDRSPKNRHKMRKTLRILPNKKNGFKMLLLAMSQYDEYCPLLFQCQPMDLWQLRRIQDNIEFLTENTHNLVKILQELWNRNIITANEAQLLTFYEEPVQELYMLLMGKSNGLIEDLIEILEVTDNPDSASILRIDLFAITMTSMEYRDFQRMWFEFLEIPYREISECFLSSGLISNLEDYCICNERTNENQMRMLLQIVPYRKGAFNALVEMMT